MSREVSMKKKQAKTSPGGVKKKARSSEALLVCACEDKEKFAGICLKGAAPPKGFKKKVIHIPKGQEVVFYCGISREKGANAGEYADQGSERVIVLGEGLKGWHKASYPEGSEYLWN
jgi:rhodanese-related sulfurtransferase